MKASRILQETPTEHGYAIRQEYWGNRLGSTVEVLSDPDDSGEDLANQLQEMLDDMPDEMLMTTCYTDDGYWIGDLETAKFLCEERGISPRPSKGVERGDLRPCNHGWCEKEKKWYGWSHRAIFGFGVGSEVKKGSCAYVPCDMEDARKDAIRFWTQDSHLNVEATISEDEDGQVCFDVSWLYSDNPDLIPNQKIRGKMGGCRSYPPSQFGNGEWVARTLDDARRMALDFAEGVS